MVPMSIVGIVGVAFVSGLAWQGISTPQSKVTKFIAMRGYEGTVLKEGFRCRCLLTAAGWKWDGFANSGPPACTNNNHGLAYKLKNADVGKPTGACCLPEANIGGTLLFPPGTFDPCTDGN